MTPYTVDVVIALEDGEELSQDWWIERYYRAAVRAGGMPPETADPVRVTLRPETDPETGDQYVRVTLPLPAGTVLGRARELAHMLTSVLAGEGYTLRSKGKLVDAIPDDSDGPPTGELGGLGQTEGRVYSSKCLGCAFSCDSRLGCCGQGAAFSLADIGAALLDGAEVFVAKTLGLPGQREGEKWHPYLTGGRCVFHDASRGCTLERARMPLQCRTYLCAPERLLPPALSAEYESYVEALEMADTFVEQHMRLESGVDFDSPLPALKEAAAKAFAAWPAETP